MTIKLWHYVDAQQQKQGPVDARVIKEAFDCGELNSASLVWNADLPQWQHLVVHAEAFRIDLSRGSRPMLNGHEVKYANFFHRWAALMIDQWVLSMSALTLVLIIAMPIYFAAGFSLTEDPDSAAALLISSVFAYLFLYIGFGGTYHIYFETSSKHGSWGKQYLGIEVRKENGEGLDRSTAALRWFSAALSHLSQNIGFLIAAFTQKRQALHDYLAHTVVIERNLDSLTAPLDRNKRALIILIMGVFVMPVVLIASMMVPMFHFIQQQEQADLQRHHQMATLVLPIQQAVSNQLAIDRNCPSQDDAKIKPLLQPLKSMSSEIYVGLSDDKQACEIYLVWDGFKTLSYRYSGEGDWTCEASHKPQDFGLNCQLTD